MKKNVLFFVWMLLIFASCEAPPRPGESAGAKTQETKKFITADEVNPEEEYVMVTTAINLPLYVTVSYTHLDVYKSQFVFNGYFFRP